MSFCCLQNCAANTECWKYINSANLLDFSANICIFRKDQDVMRKLGCSGTWTPCSDLYQWLSCQKRASVERELLLCRLWIPWCMVPLICIYLVFFVNLSTLNTITTKKVLSLKGGGRSCPIICEPGLYFQRTWKLAVRSKGDMLLKELMPPGVWISFFGNCFL